MASEWLGRGVVGVALPPIGALGLAVVAVELWFATPSQPFAVAPALIDRAGFFDTVTGWRILADFVILAAFAGIYVTPLNAVLQTEAPDQRRARFIAASNMMDATFMVVSALIVMALLFLGLGTIDILTLVTLSGLPMAFTVARFAPDTVLGRIALAIWPRKPT
jgi:acyl-[acyl-carrier-protein]-phospholipid O-acyltransferase/long-chain-fatty-acid--[acyl-carrier-protein] ligase